MLFNEDSLRVSELEIIREGSCGEDMVPSDSVCHRNTDWFLSIPVQSLQSRILRDVVERIVPSDSVIGVICRVRRTVDIHVDLGELMLLVNH